MILASLETMPVESAAGLVTRDRALAAFLSGEALDQRPPRFAEFLAVAVRLPRFTMSEAAALTSAELAPRYVSRDRKSTRLNSSHVSISYAVFCLKKKNKRHTQ